MSASIPRIAAIAIAVAVVASWQPSDAGTETAESARTTPTVNSNAKQIEQLERALDALEKSVRAIEARLGRSIQPPAPSNNIERRLQDLEKEAAIIKRELKHLEERLRRIESRRP